MKIRCPDSIACALVSNANYSDLEWARRLARRCARRELEESGVCRYLLDIRVCDAEAILRDNLSKIVRSQRPSGGWRVKNTRMLSYFYLRAFEYSRVDEEILPKLKRDPVAFLVSEDDLWGLATQRRFGEREVAQRKLRAVTSPILKGQLPNGSWENTVIATTHHIELLSEIGMSAEHEAIQAAVTFLFSQMQSEVLSRTKGMTGMAVARDMFSSNSREDEFRSAVEHKQEWKPVGLCYTHIPNMQNSYALRVLNSSGFQNDERVLKACDNLVALWERYGGFCETNLRIGVLGK